MATDTVIATSTRVRWPGPLRMGRTELIIILAVVTIAVGVGRLPHVGGAMGKTIREFRRGQSEAEADKPALLVGDDGEQGDRA